MNRARAALLVVATAWTVCSTLFLLNSNAHAPTPVVPPARAVIVCHPHWRGIRAASYQLGLPIYEAENLLSEYEGILEFMRVRNADTVVVNGIPDGFKEFAANLRRDAPSFRVSLVYHGSFSQHFTTSEGRLLDDVMHSKDVWRFGFLKPGMAQAMKAAGAPLGADVYDLGNMKRSTPVRFGKLRLLDGRFHIGVFSDHSWIKNAINQIAGACMLKGAVVHITNIPEDAAPYLPRLCSEVTIVQHGFMKHLDLQILLSSMDLTLYISLTECFPMLVLESISVGTPCLTSDTSVVYDKDPYLHEMLVISKHDDAGAIHQAISNVKSNLATIEKALPSCLDTINLLSRATWRTFLGGELPNPEDLSYIDQSYPFNHPMLLPGRPPLVPPLATSPSASFYNFLGEHTSKNVTVCFATYELGRVTAGGMGVFLDTIVRELSRLGGRPVILADMPVDGVAAWKQLCEQEGLSMMTVYHLETVLSELAHYPRTYPFPAIPSEMLEKLIYLKKSVQFAQALSFINEREGCDIIELFEYVGIGYELLRDRRAYLGYDADRVPIILRAHGSIGIIQLTSSAILGGAAPWDRETTLIHLMELMCMHRADLVLVSSPSMFELYTRFYFLPENRVKVFAPPLDSVIFHPAQVPATRSQFNIYLIYGRMHPVKGTALIIKTAVRWLTEDGISAKFLFVGINMYPDCPNRKCLLDLIPSNLMEHFTFLDFMDKRQVPEITSEIRCTIFGSVFETFSFAAYEMASLHLPAVIADIPAFKNLYQPTDAFFFDPFSSDSLLDALRASFSDSAKVDRLAKLNIIKSSYDDIKEQYTALMNTPINPDTNSATMSAKIHLLFQATVDTGKALEVLPFY